MAHLAFRLLLGAAFAALQPVALAGDAGFEFVVEGERFTYTDAQRSFGGRYFAPAGDTRRGALLLDHGQGGAPMSLPNWATFAQWDLVLIAPELTHVFGGETAPATTGHTPENLARGLACLRVLQSLADVDPARIGVFGHSKGAYAAIGQVSAFAAQVRVAAITAGGVLPDAAGVEQAAPTHSESAAVVAPFLLLHGSVDGSVPPSRSLDFANQLSSRMVPNERHVYDVEALPPEVQHNLHQDPVINADLLQRVHAWYALWGLFDDARIFADGFDDAASRRSGVP